MEFTTSEDSRAMVTQILGLRSRWTMVLAVHGEVGESRRSVRLPVGSINDGIEDLRALMDGDLVDG